MSFRARGLDSILLVLARRRGDVNRVHLGIFHARAVLVVTVIVRSAKLAGQTPGLLPIAAHGIRREGNDRNILGGWIGLDPPGGLFTVNIRQGDVHENEVRLVRCSHRDALRSAGRNQDGEPSSGEPVLQHIDVVVIVLDVENLHPTLVGCNLTCLLISRVS